jgi:hypothetical protein
MEMGSGWVEKRQHERVLATLKAEYQIISGPDVEKLLNYDSYRQTTVDRLPELSQKSPLYRAVTKDISMGGLALVSREPVQPGTVVEVSLHLPSFKSTLKFLAEIVHVETSVEMGQNLFTAGMRTMAINKGDVNHIAEYILGQKEKGELSP